MKIPKSIKVFLRGLLIMDVLGIDGKKYGFYSTHFVTTDKIVMPESKVTGEMPDIKLGRRFVYKFDLGPYVPPDNHPAISNTIRMINNGYSWQGTNERDRLVSLVTKYGSVDGCNDLVQIDNRLQNQIRIAKTIHKNGFLTDTLTLCKVTSRANGVEVAIGPLGEVIKVGDGQHRLAMALAFNIKYIPVSVIAIHASFIKNNI